MKTEIHATMKQGINGTNSPVGLILSTGNGLGESHVMLEGEQSARMINVVAATTRVINNHVELVELLKDCQGILELVRLGAEVKSDYANVLWEKIDKLVK